jgi:cytochrome c oxidase cbb3-type subunit 1
MTSFSLLQLPRYIQPLLLFAYGTMGVAGVLAWAGRRNERMYASHWYAMAAIFLFPWLFSAAQIVLLWAPLRGTAQAIAAGWFAQGAFTLWLAPLALAAAYYIVPKVTGRTLPSYDFAPLGFWTLVVLGPWTGGRHLIGGPVPAWIATVAVVACTMLLFHYLIVGLNLRAAYGGQGTATKFVTFGLTAYLLGGLLDGITCFRSVAVETQFTFLATAQEQLALYGAISMIFFGAIYFMVPRLTGRPWASAGLATGHRLLAKAGVIAVIGGLAVGGWTQGSDLLNAKTPYAEILGHLNVTLLVVIVGQAVLLAANLLLLVNFVRTVCPFTNKESTESPFRSPSTLGASAS